MAGVIQQLSPAVHGGPNYAELRELGIDPAQLLDFSVNANPAHVPQELRDALASTDITSYPDTDCLRLREAAANTYGVTPEQVVAGNGSSELIWLVGLAFLKSREQVLVRDPTFAEYERAAHIFNAEIIHYNGLLPRRTAEVAFICNPNNPTGDCLTPAELEAFVRGQPETLCVVDEAYADFVAGRPTVISGHMPENLIVLRSLTKFSALAGLRLGLAIARPSLIERLHAVKPPWNVNALAQTAGEFALSHHGLLPDLDSLEAAKAALMAGLRSLGLQPRQTSCNFFLLQVADAASTRRELLRRRCLVRDCTSFGLPDHVRIAVRTPEENRSLVAAFAEIL